VLPNFIFCHFIHLTLFSATTQKKSDIDKTAE